MNNLLIPTSDEFVETVAKAIARNRMHDDASAALENMIGVELDSSARLEETFERIFNGLWSGTNPHDERQKNQYRADARSAISAINLKLLTSTE